jgi:hypothetical protein
MTAQEIYKFKNNQFKKTGFHSVTGQWFLDLIAEFETEFHNKFPHCYANHLFANNSTMNIVNKAFNMNDDESCGMELIDGEVDIDTNLEIEKFSSTKTVYAIGSKITENEDEPIFLVTNDGISDGIVLLKYIPDDEDLDEDKVLEPVLKDVTTV